MDHPEDRFAWSHQVEVAKLPKHQPTEFDLNLDRLQCADIAKGLGVMDIAKLRFKGQLLSHSGGDWALDANLGATLTQACIATLNPVKTRIDDRIERLFTKAPEDPPARGEVEMPEDVTTEKLTGIIDLGQVMYEALALRIPLFPRDPGAGPVDVTVTEPGADPLQGADMRPFAQLKSLKEKLEKNSK